MPTRDVTPTPPQRPINTGLFRQEADYTNWRPRGTRDWLLIATIGGAGRYRTPGGDTFEARPGDVTLYEPDAPQDYSTSGRNWDSVWAHFRLREPWRPWVAWPAVLPGLRAVHAPAALQTLMEMDGVYQSGAALREAFATNLLEKALLLCHAAAPARQSVPADPRIDAAIEHLHRNLHLPVQVKDLAEVAGLSPGRFARHFLRQTGTTPQRMLEQRRLERAAELMETSALSVKEIATLCGFASAFYLSTRFRRAFGQSPTAWRKR